MKFRLKASPAFTLIELIVVVVVIAILASLAILGYNGIQANARDKALLSDIDTVESEIARYASRNNGAYSSALNWDSSSGTNANLPITPSTGNIIVVTTSDDESYCIKAYNTRSNAKTLQTAKSKGSSEYACADGWKQLAMGGGDASRTSYTCGIATNNKLYCWGLHFLGGVARTTPYPSSFTDDVKKVELSSQVHGCLISMAGLAYCTGWNSQGQLGDGTTTNNSSWVPVSTSGALAGKTILDIDVGEDSTWSTNRTCAIASDNLIYCWGNSTTPTQPPTLSFNTGAMTGKTARDIAIGNHTCIIASDGLGYCVGYNATGALGIGTTAVTNTITAVKTTGGALEGKTLKDITVGNAYTCALASDDWIYCWGANSSGQLGIGTTTAVSEPVAVTRTAALTGKTFKSVSISRGYTTCAVASDNLSYCWGSNASGQLGDGTTTGSTVPLQTPTTGAMVGRTVKSTATGYGNACVIMDNLQASCRGVNNFGQLGIGNQTTPIYPISLVTMPTL